jgi:hypothetical protein
MDTQDRPYVNVYERGDDGREHLVYRPMNDAEHAEHLEREAAIPGEAMARLRAERDALLAASDWTQMPDAPLDGEARAAYATYRQKLRDFPNRPGLDPLDPPPFPEAPA